MERKYVSLSEGIDLLGGDSEALAQAFEHGEAPLFLYARVRDFPLSGLGAYMWGEEDPFRALKLDGRWRWPDFKSSPETRIEAEDDFGDHIATICTGYFVVHPFCIRAALAGVDWRDAVSIYLVPPRSLGLAEYRSDMTPSEWMIARPDMARRGSFDGFYLSTSEIAAIAGQRRASTGVQPVDVSDARAIKSETPQAERNRRNLLRVIAALAKMQGMEARGASAALVAQLQTMTGEAPGEETVRKILKEARELADAEGPPKS